MNTYGNIELFILYVKIDRFLKKNNFKELFSRLILEMEKRPIKNYSEKKTRRIEQKINKSLCRIENTSALYFRNAKCLHRVIAQYILFRKKYCFPVKIVIGVKKFPFSSHIWLEWKGEGHNLVCESDENIVGYDIIFDSEEKFGR